jgi:hypothetical protein
LLNWINGASGDVLLSIDNIEGRYSFALADNSKETLTIIKLSETTAYFYLDRARSAIVGVADLQPDGLLYQEDQPMLAQDFERADQTEVHLTAREHHWCKLGIHFGKTDITFTDPVDPRDEKEDPQYARGACGGMYSTATFKRSTRHKLTAVEIAKLIRDGNFYDAMTLREMFLQGKTREPQ